MILIKLAPCLKNITHNSQRKPLWNIPVFGGCKETNLGSWRWWCYIKKYPSIPTNWKFYWPGYEEQCKGGRAHLGRYGRIAFPARVLTSWLLAKRTEVVTHPLLPPPCHSLGKLSPLLSVLLPSTNTDGGMIFTVDRIRLISCFVGVKCTRLFHFSNFQLN